MSLPLMPRTRAGRVLLALFSLMAAVFLLGQQGARFWTVVVPPLSFRWLLLFLAICFFLMPRVETSWKPRWTWIWAVMLGASLVALMVLRSQTLQFPSFTVQVAEAQRVQTSTLQIPSRRELRRLTRQRRNTSLEIATELSVPVTGHYRFEMSCDDVCEVQVGDTRWTARANAVEGLQLERGRHPFRIAYQQTGGPASLLFRWDTPSPVELWSIEHYLGDRTREQATRVLGAFFVWWIVFGACVLRGSESRSHWRAFLTEHRWVPVTAAGVIIVYGSLLRFESLLVHSGLATSSESGAVLHDRLSTVVPPYAQFNPTSAPLDPYRADVRSYLDRAEELTLLGFYAPSFREPFYVLLTQPFLAVAGSEMGILIQSFFFSCLTLILFYGVAYGLYGPLWSVALLVPVALHEWLILEAPTGYRASSYGFFLVLLAGLMFVEHVPAIASGLVAGLVCLIRLSGLSFALPLGVARVVELETESQQVRYAAWFGLGLGLLVIPFLVSNYNTHGDPFYSVSFHTEFWLRAEGLDVDSGPVPWTQYFTDYGRIGKVASGTFAGMTYLPVATFWRGLRFFPLLDVAVLAFGVAGLGVALASKHRFLSIAYFGHLLPFAYIQNFPSGEMPRFVMPAYFFLVLAVPVAAQALGKHVFHRASFGGAR